MQNEDDRVVDNTTAGRNDPTSSGPGTDPNLVGYNQPGANNGPGSMYNSSQQPHPNEVNHAGGGYPDPRSKHSKLGGKVESAIGTMIGSDTLRAKGMEKERLVSLVYCNAPGLMIHTVKPAV